MPDQETMKEFLVRIGYKVDEPSQRRFFAGIEGATLKANLLAEALEGMARVAAEKVSQVAATFEQLGYMSARVGSSVQHIRAFEFAVSQLGGTAAGAQGSLENFGKFLRITPGARTFIEQTLGVQTQINGVARDSADVMADIGKRLAEMSTTAAGRGIGQRFAEMFQIDDKTLLAIEQFGRFDKFFQEQLERDKAAGVGQGDAETAQRYEQSWRDVFAHIDSRATESATWIEKAITPVLEKISEEQKKIDQHGEGWFFGKQIGVAPGTGQSSVFWRFWATMFKINTTPIEGDALNGALTAVEKFAQDVETYIERLPFWRWLLGIRIGSGPVPFGGIGESGQTDIPTPDATGSGISGWWKRNMPGWLGGGRGAPTGIRARGRAGVPAGHEAELAQQGLAFLQGQGMTRDQALAVLGNAQGENPLGSLNDAGGSGQFQWDAERRRTILAGTGIDVHNAGFIDQLKAFVWEAKNSPDPRNRVWNDLLKTKTIDEGVALLVHGYERSLNQGSDIAIREGNAYRLKRLPPSPSGASAPPIPPRVGGDPGPDPKNRALRTLGYGQGEGATWNLPHMAAPREDPNAAALAAATSIDTSKTIHSNVTNNVTVSAPDPHSAAAMVGLHLDRNAHDLTSNLQGAVQ